MWSSSRGGRPLLHEVRSTSGCGTTDVCGVSAACSADVRQPGAAPSADPGHSVVCVCGLSDPGRPDGDVCPCGCLRCVGFGGDWPFNNHYHGGFGPQWMGALLPFIAIYTVAMAALAVLVGYSLLTRRPWGRDARGCRRCFDVVQAAPWHRARNLYTLGTRSGRLGT